MNKILPFYLYTFYTLHNIASKLQHKHLTRIVKANHIAEGHALFILGNNLIIQMNWLEFEKSPVEVQDLEIF